MATTYNPQLGLQPQNQQINVPKPQQPQQQSGFNGGIIPLGGLNSFQQSQGLNLQGVSPSMGQKPANPDANLSVPPNNLPSGFQDKSQPQPPNPEIQNQLGSSYNQLNDLQLKQAALQKYGLQDAQQLTKDQGGNYVPIGSPGATSQPYYPNKGLYGQIISDVSNTSHSTAGIDQARQNLLDLQNQYATTFKQIAGTPGLGQQETQGSEGLLQNLFALKQNAAQQALTNALTSQQQTLGGLESAGGLAQPMGAQALGFYDPVTKQFTQYGGGQGGGLANAGAVKTQIEQGAAVQQMLGTQSQAKALATNLGSLIDSASPNIFNSSDNSVLNNWANGVAQWIDKNVGDPNYQNFANLISEISSRYSSILNQAGGTPTDQSTLSHSIINSLAGGQDIKTVIAQLDKNATDSINALKGSAQGNAFNTNTNGNSGGSDFFNQDWFNQSIK